MAGDLDDFGYANLYEDVKLRLGEAGGDHGAIHELRKEQDRPLVEMNLIGEGGIKKIYKCYDPKNKRYVAVARPKEPKHHNVLIYEAWVLSALQHPHIINLYDVNLDAQGLSLIHI